MRIGFRTLSGFSAVRDTGVFEARAVLPFGGPEGTFGWLGGRQCEKARPLSLRGWTRQGLVYEHEGQVADAQALTCLP